MKKLNPNISCPSCNESLTPKVFGCDKCNLKIEGNFNSSEFLTLSTEELHFLRVFITCEGKISDMEKALGVSYPSVKSMLAKLKAHFMPVEIIKSKTTKDKDSRRRNVRKTFNNLTTTEVLAKLEKGELEHSTALNLIKDINKNQS